MTKSCVELKFLHQWTWVVVQELAFAVFRGDTIPWAVHTEPCFQSCELVEVVISWLQIVGVGW